MKKLLVCIFAVTMVLGYLPENVLAEVGLQEEVYAEAVLNNPKFEADPSERTGQKVTWDCIWLGTYPQTEIVNSASGCGTCGQVFSKAADYEVNASLYNELQNETGWDSSGDVTLSDGTRYRRIKKSNALYVSSSRYGYYSWQNADTYHYFRYDKIKWRVLHVSNGQAYMLADKVLEFQKYYMEGTTDNWETSNIRSWLNGYEDFVNSYGIDYRTSSFIGKAFSSAEQGAILETALDNQTDGDKLFLLSMNDLYGSASSRSYGFYDDQSLYDFAKTSKSSTYAKALGSGSYPYEDPENLGVYAYKFYGNASWRLRSSSSNNSTYNMDYSGRPTPIRVTSNAGIRPAFMLDISSNLWTYAGTVCSDGTENSGGSGGDVPSDRKYKYYSTVTKYLKQKGFKSFPSMRDTLQNWMNTELSGPIPGIIKTDISDGTARYTSVNYVPQGLCKFDSYYLVSAYEKPKELKRSAIYVLDRNWDLKTTVTIGDYAFHNGGIAYDSKDEGVLWFCGNTEPDYTGTPFVCGLAAEKLREAISSGDKMVHIDSFTADKVYINNIPSCLDYHNGRLWVGTWSSSKGAIVGYNTNGTSLDKDDAVHVTNVEKNLNGFTFDDNSTLYASYSSGRSRAKYSKISKYKVSGNYSKGSILKAENAGSIDVPRMNEEIMISGGYLYILYESGAEEYKDAFIRTDRITPLPTTLWSIGKSREFAKLRAMENSIESSVNIGETQSISFRYSSLEDVNETTCDLTFTPEESGMYTISVSDLNGSDNVFVTTEVTDAQNYFGNASTAEHRYTDEDESNLPYDLFDGSSCKVFLSGGNTYNISMTADILESEDSDTYEAEDPTVEFSGSYNLTVSGETDLSDLVPEAAEGEEKTLAVSEGDAGCFCFTPEKTGTYRIDLSSNGTLGDILILKDMKDAVSFNGELCDLEAGEKYYFITSLSEGSDTGADAEIRFTASGLESEDLGTDEPVTVTGDTSINYTATDDGMQIIKVEGGTVEQITVFDQNGDTIAAGDGDVVFETQKNEKYRILCTGCNGEISVSVSAYNEDGPDDPTPDDPTPVDPQPIDPTPTPTPAPTVTPAPQAPAEIQDLPAVKMSKPAAAKKSVNVKWKKVTKKNQKKIQGIEIQIATDPDFTDIVKTATAGKKKTSKKIKGLTSKQTYYVRIRAYKDAADGRHVSAWKAKKVKAK